MGEFYTIFFGFLKLSKAPNNKNSKSYSNQFNDNLKNSLNYSKMFSYSNGLQNKISSLTI